MPKTLKRALLIAGAVWVVTVPSAAAQDAAAEETRVVAVVEKLFEAMSTQDTAAIRSVFEPSARLVNASGRNGMSVTTVDQFVHSIGRVPAGMKLIERIYAPEVRIDGNLATVWTFYTFHRGDQFSHCGYDAVQLMRLENEWKIVHLADTRRTSGCDPPGGG